MEAIEDRRAFRITQQIQRTGARQFFAPAKVVIEEQPQANKPHRAIARVIRQHEAHRPDDMRRGVEQDFTLNQRLAHQAKLVILEIA